MPFSILLKKGQPEINKILNNYREDLGNIIISTQMPNHFHILIKCLEDKSISKLMQKTLTSYAMYYNNKYSKKGHRFESKYKYRKIKDSNDLRNTMDYIHKNPAKLLDKNYKHIDLIKGYYKLTPKQKSFVENYPFTFQGPTFEKIRLDLD